MKLNLETADLVTFTEEIVNGKLHFLCSVGLIFSNWPSEHSKNTELTETRKQIILTPFCSAKTF